MREMILDVIRVLGAPGAEKETLELLCDAACERLDGLLAGVTAEDCGGAYPLSAAFLVLDWLGAGRGWEGIASLSAGDMTVRREPGGGGELEKRAMELMAPWLRDRNFVFQGVRG